MCLVWLYNFINNKNTTDNVDIWNEYLKRHPTIVCNQVSKLLFKRRETEKLRLFLNFGTLNKQHIVKSELGRAYSRLFDDLFFKGHYDILLNELQNVLAFLSLKDFRPETLNRMKSGPEEFTTKFWSVINSAK